MGGVALGLVNLRQESYLTWCWASQASVRKPWSIWDGQSLNPVADHGSVDEQPSALGLGVLEATLVTMLSSRLGSGQTGALDSMEPW